LFLRDRNALMDDALMHDASFLASSRLFLALAAGSDGKFPYS
jgi:hypothetical protein